MTRHGHRSRYSFARSSRTSPICSILSHQSKIDKIKLKCHDRTYIDYETYLAHSSRIDKIYQRCPPCLSLPCVSSILPQRLSIQKQKTMSFPLTPVPPPPAYHSPGYGQDYAIEYALPSPSPSPFKTHFHLHRQENSTTTDTQLPASINPKPTTQAAPPPSLRHQPKVAQHPTTKPTPLAKEN